MKSIYLFSFLLFSAIATSPNLYGSDLGLPFFTGDIPGSVPLFVSNDVGYVTIEELLGDCAIVKDDQGIKWHLLRLKGPHITDIIIIAREEPRIAREEPRSVKLLRIAPEKVKWSDQQPKPKLLVQGVSSDSNENKPKGPGLLGATERLGTEPLSQSSRSSSSPGLTGRPLEPKAQDASEQPKPTMIAKTKSIPSFTSNSAEVKPFQQGPSWQVIAGAAVVVLGGCAGVYCWHKRSQSTDKSPCLNK